ncbi:FAD-dependent monooxygenase [Mycobacterium sp. C31M]
MSGPGGQPGRALVVGMGIAGLATAIRLHRSGWQPVMVERAAGRRTGGYFIATMGTGQAAATRLGIRDVLPDRTPPPGSAMYDIDRSGRRRPTRGIFDLPISPKPMLMLRGDVECALFEALPADVELRFSTIPVAIVQDLDGVDVTLQDLAAGSESTERFDLVVGADGLRSTVRSLVFGPHDRILRRLDHVIAACELAEPPAGLGAGEGAMLFEPGRSLIVYPFADHLPTALFSYRSDDIDAEFAEPPVERLRKVYGPVPHGSMLAEVIEAFGAAQTVTFASVEQPCLDSWHRGRVVLVGDSAWCPTLYSGMGSSTAMAGADLLGTVLDERPDNLEIALAEWERRLRPYTEKYQKAGAKAAFGFTPPTRFRIAMRRLMVAARGWRLTAPLLNAALHRAPSFAVRNVDIAAAM